MFKLDEAQVFWDFAMRTSLSLLKHGEAHGQNVGFVLVFISFRLISGAVTCSRSEKAGTLAPPGPIASYSGQRTVMPLFSGLQRPGFYCVCSKSQAPLVSIYMDFFSNPQILLEAW